MANRTGEIEGERENDFQLEWRSGVLRRRPHSKMQTTCFARHSMDLKIAGYRTLLEWVSLLWILFIFHRIDGNTLTRIHLRSLSLLAAFFCYSFLSLELLGMFFVAEKRQIFRCELRQPPRRSHRFVMCAMIACRRQFNGIFVTELLENYSKRNWKKTEKWKNMRISTIGEIERERGKGWIGRI